MDTKKIAAVPVDAKTFTEYTDAKLKRVIAVAAQNLAQNIDKLAAEFTKKFQSRQWIFLNRAGQAEGVYYSNELGGLIPDLDVHTCNAGYSHHAINSDFINPKNLKFAGFQGVIPSEAEAEILFNDQISYFRNSDGRIKVRGSTHPGLTIDNGSRYMFTQNSYNYSIETYNSYRQDYFWVIPIYKFSGGNVSVQQIFWLWLAYDLTPRDFDSADTRKLFDKLKNFYAHHGNCIKLQGDKITLDENKIFDAVKSGTKFDFLKTDFLEAKTIKGVEFEHDFRAELLAVDYKRVGLDSYDAKILSDPNRGHWDLWDLPTDGESTITLSEAMYARDPAADVNAAGIVGIDFGTKSTVVVYENERGEIIPLQVGRGDYSRGIRAENYENPTIIEFRHIENFLAAYAARAGRPKTSLNDVTVSHTAQENLKATRDSGLYASFFENLKQWCGNLQYTTKIRDHDGTEKDLPPFLDIAKDEFNPLEYYAYYLGAYINHMLQPKHIFLKYILSFPVMYERNIRERMLKAFRAGILKSLPTALLSNENEMQKFQVVEGTSEPAAYAITALEGFGFLNGEENDGVYYAVFDFGGGTTDFDFGVLRLAEDDDADFYDYVLTHFGAHGDRTLGGENLLRLLAFQVFKANSAKLLKPRENSSAKIPFTWAAEKMEFAGSEGLIRSSQEANLNMHNLMEALRPVWEAPDSDAAKKIFSSGKISLTVFDDAGAEIPEFELLIGAETPAEKNPAPAVDLKDLIDRISHGAEITASYDDRESFERSSRILQENISKLRQNAAVTGDLEILIGAIIQNANAMNPANNKKIRAQANLSLQENISKIRAALRPKSAAPAENNSAPVVDLKKILRDRITQGVESFFISLRDAFDKVSGGEDNGVAALSDVKEISIFLAGNGTKSALIKEIFEEYTNSETGKARAILGFGKSQQMPEFILYPPLGTDAADKIQAERGVTVDKNNFARPTGKTGVAFGLLRSREGSAIRVVDITPEGRDKKQVPFQFYIGRQRLGKFKIVLDKSAKLGEWHKFIGAKLGVFDLLYTDDSRAATNDAPASIAKRLTLKIDADPEASVYIKAVESNKICYAVAKDTPGSDVEGGLITLD